MRRKIKIDGTPGVVTDVLEDSFLARLEMQNGTELEIEVGLHNVAEEDKALIREGAYLQINQGGVQFLRLAPYTRWEVWRAKRKGKRLAKQLRGY